MIIKYICVFGTSSFDIFKRIQREMHKCNSQGKNNIPRYTQGDQIDWAWFRTSELQKGSFSDPKLGHKLLLGQKSTPKVIIISL